MSRSLFNGVPAGAIEVISNAEGLLQFKRADLGRFLGLVDIRAAYRDVKTTSRKLLIPHASDACPPKDKNDQDAFIDLDGALEIVVRSKKPKAVELVKWLTRKGVEKLVEDVRQLEYNNTGLQGEIRAKDQEIERRQKENVELKQRYVDRCQDMSKDNVVMIVRKHTCEHEDCHSEYPYYVSRIQRRKIPAKRRWIIEQFPQSEEIVVIDNPNSVHTFNRFEEEGHVERYGCHFRLIDLTREDLYAIGVPAIKE